MVRTIDIEITSNDINAGILEVLKHIKPEWKEEDAEISELTGGNTNHIYRAKHSQSGDNILFKIYGNKSDLFINRDEEIETMETLHLHDRGPKVYCRFKNGIVYGYIEGAPLEWFDLSASRFMRLIAEEFAAIHNIPLPDDAKPRMFEKIRSFIEILPDNFPDSQRQELFSKFPTREELHAQVDDLEVALLKLNSPIMFCHNDVLFSNAIYNDKTNSIRFIDYEYAFANYQAFDVANHFCEFSGLETYSGEYPSDETQIEWLTSYVRKLSELKNEKYCDDDMKLLKEHVHSFSMMPDLFWCVWAVIQARHDNGNLDFLSYSVNRMDVGYFAKMAKAFPDIHAKHKKSHDAVKA